MDVYDTTMVVKGVWKEEGIISQELVLDGGGQ